MARTVARRCVSSSTAGDSADRIDRVYTRCGAFPEQLEPDENGLVFVDADFAQPRGRYLARLTVNASAPSLHETWRSWRADCLPQWALTP